MNRIYLLLCYLPLLINCNAQQQTQTQKVGGPCKGCEAIFEYGSKVLSAIDTLADFKQTEPKLKLHGTVYKEDGKTPAENVIIYIYHTDREGLYTAEQNAAGWGRKHGYLRGWTKTNKLGQYTFYTFRPAAYPSGTEPEHIHITIKEPDKNEYYIDEIVFTDDPLLTKAERPALSNRGGSGMVSPILKAGIQHIKRDIFLGLNIPNY